MKKYFCSNKLQIYFSKDIDESAIEANKENKISPIQQQPQVIVEKLPLKPDLKTHSKTPVPQTGAVLIEKSSNVILNQLPHSPQQQPKIEFEKFDNSISGSSYLVQFLYAEETDEYLYVSLMSEMSKLEKLDVKLQEPTTDNKACEYIRSLVELKVDDRLEALFDMDSKWYRVKVTKIGTSSFEIYFLDYGNSQLIENVNSSYFKQRPMLRRRNLLVDNSEILRLDT